MVEAFLRQEFLVSSHLNNSSLIKDYDAVCISHGGKPVSNNEAGTPFSYAANRPLHDVFCVGINTRGSLVEYQDGRISQYCTGQADQLALSGTDVTASFPHLRFVAIFQTRNKIVSPCCFCCLNNFFVVGFKMSVPNILLYGGLKEKRVLGDNTYIAS